MFNVVNLMPNKFVNVKGKGKQYIDSVDMDATNPDNKFGHAAVLIKKGPSDSGNGEWHSWVDLEDSPPETEKDRQDIYTQEKTTQSFKKGLANQGPSTQSKLKEKNKMKLAEIAKQIKTKVHNENVRKLNEGEEHGDAPKQDWEKDADSFNNNAEVQWNIEAKICAFIKDDIYAENEEGAKNNLLKELKRQLGSAEIEITEFKATKKEDRHK